MSEAENQNNKLMAPWECNENKNKQVSGNYYDVILYIRHDWRRASIYSENISGVSYHYPLIKNVTDKLNKYASLRSMLQLVENGLLDIGICDERWKEYVELSDTHKNFSNYSKIYQLDLENEDFKGEIIKKKIGAFIIHQGLIDKHPISNKDFMDLKDHCSLIIVTSGRGKPKDLWPGAKFLPFSILESSLFIKEHHEKFLLTQAIKNLKRKEELCESNEL